LPIENDTATFPLCANVTSDGLALQAARADHAALRALLQNFAEEKDRALREAQKRELARRNLRAPSLDHRSVASLGAAHLDSSSFISGSPS
jgi:hypothetical protein